jgi:hypothetical protein
MSSGRFHQRLAAASSAFCGPLMPSVITFAPIAAQLARLISLDELLPRDAVADVLREHRRHSPEAHEAKLPEDVEPFLGH